VKRILVVGGGLIGFRHLQAVQAHAGCKLVGLADPDMSIQSDVPRFAKMGDVMMPVDGVIIATPTHLHASHGIEAAERGWHMLIEKPVAEKLESAKKLETALRSKNIRSLVGHHRRYHAVVQQLKACLQDGLIGEVVNVSVLWAMRKPDVYFEGNWRTDGGSPVMINLVHDIDILRFVIGEITQTVALRGRSLRGSTRVESGAVALAFENGAVGTISFADTTPSPWGFEAGTGENPNIGTTKQDMMWITGTKGAISFPSMTVWKGTDWGSSAKPITFEPAQNMRTPLEAQLDHFVDVINGDEPLIDVADAASTLAIAQELENQLATPNSNKATKSV
jgi:predicted dehydrogenase|tara:strand:- start:317 stop:1324 length:1008 start_codon:yes stop_codon:yes gene_type:complete